MDSNKAAGNRSILKAQYILITVAAALMLIKFLAFYITNSNSILTDAMESLVNVVAAFVGLYSLKFAFLPADANHPYGHGKIEFLSAGLEGVLIFAAGAGIFLKSIYNIFYPQEIETLGIGIILTAVAGAVNYAVGTWVRNEGVKKNSLILQAGGKHLLSDAWSSAILVTGLLLVVYFKYPFLDSVLSSLLSLYIMYIGWGLLRQSVAGVMDEADDTSIEKIISILSRDRRENWIDIHNFRIIKYGASFHVDCHVTVPYYLNVEQAHDEIDAMEKVVNKEADVRVEWFVHIDPCRPTSCHLCIKSDCPVRQFPFIAKEEWTLENIKKNQQHGKTTEFFR